MFMDTCRALELSQRRMGHSRVAPVTQEMCDRNVLCRGDSIASPPCSSVRVGARSGSQSRE
eukprot:8481330-Pyramimonas_sp.AAC.1